MSTVGLKICDRAGNVKAEVEIDANDALTFTVDAPVRIGHLRGPAETLGNLLGTTVEFEIRSSVAPEIAEAVKSVYDDISSDFAAAQRTMLERSGSRGVDESEVPAPEGTANT